MSWGNDSKCDVWSLCRRGLLAYVYSGVSLTMNVLNALVAGNGSYIVRPCGHDLHGPTVRMKCLFTLVRMKRLFTLVRMNRLQRKKRKMEMHPARTGDTNHDPTANTQNKNVLKFY